MPSLAIILVGLGGFLGIQLLLQLYRLITSPLRSVPGPFLARFTDLWYIWKLRGGSFEVVNQELHEKYGPIVRYGPNRYSFRDATASKAIYSHGTPFAKSDWYAARGPPGPDRWDLFVEPDVDLHARYRRQYQSAYSMSALVEYEPYVDECADLFAQRLSELSLPFSLPGSSSTRSGGGGGGVAVNMGHWLQCYAFDVIGCITYSKRLGFLDQGRDIGGLIAALENSLVYSTFIGVYAFLHPYLFALNEWLAKAKASRNRQEEEIGGMGYVVNFTQEMIAEHQARPKALDDDDDDDGDGDDDDDGNYGEKANANASGGKARDFLSKFLTKHTQDPTRFSTYHILQGCASNMIAGSDTTSISLSAILYYLLKDPRCFHRLREEVAVAESEFEFESSRAGRIPTNRRHIGFKESQEMPYLQAVIKEALRLHPATGLPLECVVPPGGATIAGCFFPEGSIVGVNTWVEHRNTRIFGEDAGEFKPERWLTEDTEKLAFMNRHWMPFGLGSRTCIGRHISHLEISKLIPRLVRDFDFELAGDLAKKDVSWSTENYWFVKPKDFMVLVISRESS